MNGICSIDFSDLVWIGVMYMWMYMWMCDTVLGEK